MEVESASTAATAEVDGSTYSFCSTGCQDHFLAEQGSHCTKVG
jgi:YHS domain-containing protein